MLESINIHHPTVVYPDADLDTKFEYAEYGTISFNGRPPLPIPTETLLLLREEFRLIAKQQEDNEEENSL